MANPFSQDCIALPNTVAQGSQFFQSQSVYQVVDFHSGTGCMRVLLGLLCLLQLQTCMGHTHKLDHEEFQGLY